MEKSGYIIRSAFGMGGPYCILQISLYNHLESRYLGKQVAYLRGTFYSLSCPNRIISTLGPG